MNSVDQLEEYLSWKHQWLYAQQDGIGLLMSIEPRVAQKGSISIQ